MREHNKTNPEVRQIRAILARWDAIAYTQLAAAAACLRDVVSELRARAERAEDTAEFWESAFQNRTEHSGESDFVASITPDCRFVTTPRARCIHN